MQNIELSGELWHLSRDGEGYSSHDGKFQAKRKGMAWTIWQRSEGDRWNSVKTLSSLPKVREWIETQYAE